MAELNRAALEAMRDAAMATAQAQLKLAAACAAALGEEAPKLTKDGRKARGKREKDPNRPAYAETAYQLFMKETRATNTSLPKGKEVPAVHKSNCCGASRGGHRRDSQPHPTH